jgi:two-component system, OmpR family, sensor kinase
VEAALEQQHAVEERLRAFAADAGHELRTPVSTIRGHAELALRRPTPLPDEVRHALTRIEAESQRMSVIVDDLLLLARLDAGRPLEHTEVDLTRVVLDAVEDARAAAPDHRWRLALPEEPTIVPGDTHRLAQAVLNLVTNARVHTPAGTEVTVAVEDADDLAADQVRVQVTDDGPGLDPVLAEQAFDRFTRGDRARSRAAGSTGLGLAITRAIAEAHGGHVEVSSRPGRTTFTLTLKR